jgi:type II secretion system (T2SS) protein E
MRQASTSAFADSSQSANEFGTGLRARLQVVRDQEQEELLKSVLSFRNTGRPDFSPELALVSQDDSLGGLMLEVTAARDVPLGTLLAEAGLLQASELDFALAHSREHGMRLGEVLVEHGLVSASEVVRLVAAQHGLPFIDVRRISVDPAAAKLLPADLARDNRAVPVGFIRGLPVVAVADPTDDGALHDTRSILHSVRFVASPEEAILFQLAQLYIGLGSMHLR